MVFKHATADRGTTLIALSYYSPPPSLPPIAMDLAAHAIKGLSLLGDKTQLPDAAFKATVIAACHSLVHPEEDTGLLGRQQRGGMTSSWWHV